MNNTILIIDGCGGHARSVADVGIANNYQNIFFIDDNAKMNETVLGFPVLKNCHQFPEKTIHRIVGIGDNFKRYTIFNNLARDELIVLRSPHAYISKSAHIAKGVFIGHQSYLGPNVIIHENTIINTRSLIEHDCVIGKHSHISINATIAGKCTIGDFVMLGANATVIDNIKICSQVIVGAGAVVVRDISSPGIYVGVPAKKVDNVLDKLMLNENSVTE